MENNTSTEFVNLVMRKIAKQHHGYSNANQFMRSEGLRVRRSIVKSIHNGTLLNVLRHYKVQVKVPERILKSLSERRRISKMKNKRDVNLVTAVSRLDEYYTPRKPPIHDWKPLIHVRKPPLKIA